MIDLHTHSSVSDGSDSPAELVRKAAEAGCTTIALTDHDTTDGLADAMAVGLQVGVQVLAGIELSCHTERRTVHVLGYFQDYDHPVLQAQLLVQRDLRTERNQRLVERMNEIGMPITMEDVLEHGSGPSVGRPHVAAALMKAGYVNSIDEAFRRFLADGSIGHVQRRGLAAEDGIEMIHRAGGVAVWAHPYTPPKYGGTDLQPCLGQLVDAGLDGLECYYGRYEPKVRRRLARIADTHGLIAIGGSDYHGTYKPDLFLGSGTGNLEVPKEALDALNSALASR